MLLIPPIEPSQSKFWPRSHCSCVARSARVGLNQGLTLKNGGFVRRKHDKHGMLPTKNMLNMEITERTKRKIYSFNQEGVLKPRKLQSFDQRDGRCIHICCNDFVDFTRQAVHFIMFLICMKISKRIDSTNSSLVVNLDLMSGNVVMLHDFALQ